MGKRSTFERRERDFYPTPFAAVAPLLQHLPPCSTFIEPCAGDGALIGHLESAGHQCVAAQDIEPRGDVGPDGLAQFTGRILWGDARTIEESSADFYITNPPWTRDYLHPIVQNLASILPTWLLFDADWMHTRQAAPYLPLCRKIVSVGRVKWIPDSAFTGKDNCAWYLFDARSAAPAVFVGREAA
jgi:hypothetical protein